MSSTAEATLPPAGHPSRNAAPTITTPRLELCLPVEADAPTLAALLSSPETNPSTPVETKGVEHYRQRVGRWVGQAERGERAFMVIKLRETGKVIGFGGFNEFRWVARAAGEGDDGEKVLEADTGVVIDTKHWRKGYGKEAIVAKAEYAFNVLGAEFMSIDTSLDNEPWRALMRDMGLGAVETKSSASHYKEGEETEVWLYRFSRTDWETARADMMRRGKWPL
jgi:RimJ/RimL family protein N-acetyltransferase